MGGCKERKYRFDIKFLSHLDQSDIGFKGIMSEHIYISNFFNGTFLFTGHGDSVGRWHHQEKGLLTHQHR